MSDGNESHTEVRPWGEFTVLLDAPDVKVKRITVNAGKRLSLQRHKLREEFWTIVSGVGIVTQAISVDDLDEETVNPGDTIHILRNEIHRIEAGPDNDVVFIEVQLGDYFGEDDIIRYEDDYNRS